MHAHRIYRKLRRLILIAALLVSAMPANGIASRISGTHISLTVTFDDADPNAAHTLPGRNSPRTIAYAGAQATSGSLVASLDAHCGSSATAWLLGKVSKAFSELHASNYAAATADTRFAIKKASTCVMATPNPCLGLDWSPCNDSAHARIEGTQLASQQILRLAIEQTHGHALDELRNEVATTLDLCASPNILSPSQPYQTIRSFMTETVTTVSKMNHVRDISRILNVDAIRACGSKLGVQF